MASVDLGRHSPLRVEEGTLPVRRQPDEAPDHLHAVEHRHHGGDTHRHLIGAGQRYDHTNRVSMHRDFGL